jgi:hypothetical protein
MKNHTKKILLTVAILLAAITGYSDEHEENDVSTNSETTQQQIETAPQSSDQSEGTEAFIPTESISEDLSVPFPVDI